MDLWEAEACLVYTVSSGQPELYSEPMSLRVRKQKGQHPTGISTGCLSEDEDGPWSSEETEETGNEVEIEET